MANEPDPYLDKVTNMEHVAIKRLRKESLGRGNRARQYVEKKAPKWGPEQHQASGGPISFHPGSNGPHILDNGGHGTRKKGQY